MVPGRSDFKCIGSKIKVGIIHTLCLRLQIDPTLIKSFQTCTESGSLQVEKIPER